IAHALILSLEWLHNDAPDGDPCRQADAGRWHNQIRAAVGEQLRRRHPGERCCAGRKLNEWTGTIRDWRIRLVDDGNTAPFDGPYKKQPRYALEREMEAWRRRGTEYNEAEAMTFQRIHEELEALNLFYLRLLGDDEWRKKRWAKLDADQKRARIHAIIQPLPVYTKSTL